MLHDPNTFDNPSDFIPERYLDADGNLDPSVPDSEMAGFGFGRRIYPGRHFGKDTIFLFAASILATFNIAQPKDEEGNRVSLDLELRQALIA
jgi:cytochrome P450